MPLSSGGTGPDLPEAHLSPFSSQLLLNVKGPSKEGIRAPAIPPFVFRQVR